MEGSSLPCLALEEVQLSGYVTLGELEQAIMLVADGRVKTATDGVKPLEAGDVA